MVRDAKTIALPNTKLEGAEGKQSMKKKKKLVGPAQTPQTHPEAHATYQIACLGPNIAFQFCNLLLGGLCPLLQLSCTPALCLELLGEGGHLVTLHGCMGGENGFTHVSEGAKMSSCMGAREQWSMGACKGARVTIAA